LLGLLAVPLSVGLVERVLKPAFGRTYGGNLTYPSGHATALFAIAATSAVLLAPTRPGNFRALRIAIPVMMSLVGCAVAAGVIGLRWHYFTDTVAGAAVGVLTVCGLSLVLDLPVVRSYFARAGRTMPATEEAEAPPLDSAV
jgi:membrane-associated phospholipid phosphatase